MHTAVNYYEVRRFSKSIIVQREPESYPATRGSERSDRTPRLNRIKKSQINTFSGVSSIESKPFSVLTDIENGSGHTERKKKKSFYSFTCILSDAT